MLETDRLATEPPSETLHPLEQFFRRLLVGVMLPATLPLILVGWLLRLHRV